MNKDETGLVSFGKSAFFFGGEIVNALSNRFGTDHSIVLGDSSIFRGHY